MLKRRFRLPSPALVISMITLSLVLGGTAVAAQLSGDKKADIKLVKKLAPSLSVKHARTADSATNARNATDATHATSADSATNAISATHAASADSATNATDATHATSAANATHATSADSATTAGSAPPSGAAGGALSGTYPDPSLKAPEAWHEIGAAGEPAFQNGWANESPSEVTAAFYADPNGEVHLKGLITGGTNAPVFDLPAGYRPGSSLCELVFRSGSGSGQLCVFAAGDVAVLSGTGSASLDGVTFRIGE